MMQLLVIVGADIAARKNLFQVLEEVGVDGHHVFKVAVLRTVLHHQDLAVALDDLRLDLARLLVHQDLDRQFAVDDLLANLGNALGAERIRGAGPAERGLRLLVRLEERLVRPLGRERRIGMNAIQFVENHPCAFSSNGDGFLNVLYGLMHLRLSCWIV